MPSKAQRGAHTNDRLPIYTVTYKKKTHGIWSKFLLKCEIRMEVNITLAVTKDIDTLQQQHRAFTDSDVHGLCSRQILFSL